MYVPQWQGWQRGPPSRLLVSYAYAKLKEALTQRQCMEACVGTYVQLRRVATQRSDDTDISLLMDYPTL